MENNSEFLGSVASTNMNAMSSRSHAIFTITVECSTELGTNSVKGKGRSIRMGKLNLVDLAVSTTGNIYLYFRVVHILNWTVKIGI